MPEKVKGLKGICQHCGMIVSYESFDQEWCPEYAYPMPNSRKHCDPKWVLSAEQMEVVKRNIRLKYEQSLGAIEWHKSDYYPYYDDEYGNVEIVELLKEKPDIVAEILLEEDA